MDEETYRRAIEALQARAIKNVYYPNGKRPPFGFPTTPVGGTHYRDYIRSDSWEAKSQELLAQSDRHCALLGIPAGKKAAGVLLRTIWIFERVIPWLARWIVSGKKRRLKVPRKRYWGACVHHMKYDKPLGEERLGKEAIVLSPFGHWIIHQVLGGHYRAGNQPFGKFPNLAQRLAHAYCCVPWKYRWPTLAAIAILILLILRF